jgi:hypothetical protein
MCHIKNIVVKAMSDEENSSWQDMPVTHQIQALQMNVHRIGLVKTLQKAVKGELEPEDLLEP